MPCELIETGSVAGRATSSTATTVATTATTVTTATTATVTTTATATTSAVTAFATNGLLVSLLLEPRSVFGVVGFNGEGLGPEIGGKVSVGVHEGNESSLQEVLSGSSMTSCLGVAILDTSEGEHLLGDGGTDNTGTTGGGHQLYANGSALSGDLAWHGMHMADLVTPIAASDGHKLELGVNESALDGDLHFLADLDAETNMASHVTDGDNSLKAGTLTSLGLLLDGNDLHDIVLELVLGCFDEFVDNTGLLDGDGVSVDFLEGLDVVSLNESSEFGLGEPFVLGGATTATGAATTATATEASASLATAVTTTATAFATSFSTSFAASFAGCYWLSFHRKYFKSI